jgi:hypothetical protein
MEKEEGQQAREGLEGGSIMSNYTPFGCGFNAGREVSPSKPAAPPEPIEPAAVAPSLPAPRALPNQRHSPLGPSFARIADRLDRDFAASRAFDCEQTGLVDAKRPTLSPDPFDIAAGAEAASLHVHGSAALDSRTERQFAEFIRQCPEATPEQIRTVALALGLREATS